MKQSSTLARKWSSTCDKDKTKRGQKNKKERTKKRNM